MRFALLLVVIAACGGKPDPTKSKKFDDLLAGKKAQRETTDLQRDNENQATEKQFPDLPSHLAGRDVLKNARNLNSSKYAKPPSNFRKGHAQKTKAPKVAKTSNGFNVSFPSKTPVATPVLYKGALYSTGGFSSKEFYAMDPRTGDVKWSVHMNDDGPSSAACADGMCIVNTESCTVFALDANTGAHKWSWWLGDPMMSTPTIAKGQVFVAYPASGRKSGTGKAPPRMTHVMAAIDVQTGKINWQKWIDADVLSAPVADGDNIHITTFGGTIYTFTQSTGNIVMARRERATSAPVVADNGDLLYSQRSEQVGSKAKEALARLDVKTGKKLFVEQGQAAPYLESAVQRKTTYVSEGSQADSQNGFGGGAPAAANAKTAAGLVGQTNVSTLQAFQGSRLVPTEVGYATSMGNKVVMIDGATGKKLWHHDVAGDLKKAGGSLVTTPIVVSGHVVVGTVAGKVLVLDAKTGKVRKTITVGAEIRAQPIVHNGWLYVGSQRGKLIAINTADKSLSGWTQWGKNAERTSL